MPKLKASYTEVLELKGAHSLIRSHKPTNLPLEGIQRIMQEQTLSQIEKFGLFDSGSPNYSTYYPDVTAEDLVPQDADFIYPTYRLLSKVIIDPKRGAIDFSQNDALKNSMSLLIGQTIYIDHETATGTAMGTVMEVAWQEAYKIGGKTIPAGINGVLKIDAKSNPRIARSIMMDPPAIHSTSVSISFSWKPSHPQLTEDEFWSLLGSFAKDGKRVSKIVDDIKFYLELSLVSHGADPFAKQVRDGKIVMATHASRIYNMSLSANLLKVQPHMMLSPAGDPLSYNYSEMSFKALDSFNTNLFNINNNPQDNMDLLALIANLGLDAQDMDEETFIAHIKAELALAATVPTLNTQIETLTGEKTELETRVQTLTQSNTELTTQVTNLSTNENAVFAAAGKLAIEDARKEALKFYRLAKGDKADANIEASINGADMASANAFMATFKTEYETEVPLTCQDCNSTHVSRKSSKTSEPGKTPLNAITNARDQAAKTAVKNFLK